MVTFGNSRVTSRRNAHLRALASSSVTRRAGRAAASGMPGAPPPEPTSTIGPTKRRTTSRALRLSSTCTRRASSRSRIEVKPGVARRTSSQRSSRSSTRRDHDEPVRLGPLAGGHHAGIVLQPQVHDLPLNRGHRLELDALPRRDRTLGAPHRERVQRLLPPLAIARRIDDDRLPVFGLAAVDDCVRQVLNRIDRLPVLADQKAEVTAGERGGQRLLVLLDRQPRMHPDLANDAIEELADGGGKLALVDSLADFIRIVVRSNRRDHAGRSKTHTEQAALALGDDLELDRRLVE